jgi:alpha-N-arabinofuranosidase
MILTDSATVPYVHARPALPREPAPPVPTSGNFAIRDEFDATSLAPSWVFLRTPRERWYDLESPRGALTLRARPVDLSGQGQPSFVARRQQHLRATASTAVRFVPEKAGDRAGLAAFHNETHYFLLSVTSSGGKSVVRLERRAGNAPGTQIAVVAEAPLAVTPGAPVYLRIAAREGRYDFSYGVRPNDWRPLAADQDGTILSTKVAGGFVGTMFGLFARADTATLPSSAP